MGSLLNSINHRLIRQTATALVLLGVSFMAPQLMAQNTPVISGGAGFFSYTDGGKTSYDMAVAPLLAAPVGPHLFFEGRGVLLEALSPARTGGYNTSRFFGLSYMQADVIANKHVTLVGGYFLTPFGSYNERLTPLWIGNFQDVPLIYGIGTMNTGASTGGMIRGNLLSTDKVSVSYTAYVSAGSTNVRINSQRSTGGQASVYLPKARLEVGTSFGRRLETVRENDFGTHLWWEPVKVPIEIRSEYAHAPHSQGYWIEADYHLPKFSNAKWVGRLEPLARVQQAFRNSPDKTDNLPSVDTQRVDFGLSYHFPREVRINTTYGRNFASNNGNVNIWQTGLTYRFLTPTWKGK
jgi:hypothetical protein